MCRYVNRLALISLCVLFASTTWANDPAKEVKLFDGKSLSGWEYFLVDGDAKMEDVWSVEEGILVCKGEPGGYLCTKKNYESYRLVVEWRWPEKPGNSGVLMRITGEPTMLPNCVEAQLKSGSAGDMYGFQGFKIDGDKDRKFENPNAVGGAKKQKDEKKTITTRVMGRFHFKRPHPLLLGF